MTNDNEIILQNKVKGLDKLFVDYDLSNKEIFRSEPSHFRYRYRIAIQKNDTRNTFNYATFHSGKLVNLTDTLLLTPSKRICRNMDVLMKFLNASIVTKNDTAFSKGITSAHFNSTMDFNGGDIITLIYGIKKTFDHPWLESVSRFQNELGSKVNIVRIV